jgi:S-adenosylmethionine synthetase
MPTDLQLFHVGVRDRGHPDKLADAISDAILDACLAGRPASRVAIETLLTRGLAVVAGELTTNTYVEVADVVRKTAIEVGYDNTDLGFDGHTTGVTVAIQKQSADIAMGVDTGGAGDQGMMFGFACDETSSLMPLPIAIAHALTHRQADLRANRPELGLRPDAKSQVTIAYDAAGRPSHVDTLVLSTQHHPDLSHEQVEAIVEEHIFEPVLAQFGPVCGEGATDIKRYVNPDRPVRHRRPAGRHRPDRAQDHRGHLRRLRPPRRRRVLGQGPDEGGPLRGVCRALPRQAGGRRGPGEEVRDSARLRHRRRPAGLGARGHVRHRHDPRCGDRRAVAGAVRPDAQGIIDLLDLRRPIYRDTARNGHFGNPAFPWEGVDRSKELLG